MTEKNEQKVEPAVHGMRRKGTTAIIGIIPNQIAGVPPKLKEYLRDFEEVPLYTTPPLDALRALEQKWRERSQKAHNRMYTADVVFGDCADDLAATIKAMGGENG